MKKITLLLILCLTGGLVLNAQTTVDVDATTQTYIGFANVFDLPEDGGGYQFGSAWAVEDLKSTVDATNNIITLQPNFNTYADNPTDPYWVDQTTLEGNKTFEGNTYFEANELVGEEITFIGAVTSYTLDPEYEAVAFIKVFNSDFSVLKIVTQTLTEEGAFSITYDQVEAADAVVQIGFYVSGPNANPDDEVTLGSVVVTSQALSVSDLVLQNLKLYPNPSRSQWNINTRSGNIQSVSVIDILGKEVSRINVENVSVSIPTSTYQKGVYFAKVKTDLGEAVLKLVKN